MDCQEIVARRSDASGVPTPPAQTNATMQPRTRNPTVAPTPKPFDPKRIATLLANEYNESIGIVDIRICLVGVDNDTTFTGVLMEEPLLISVPDALPHRFDDFLAVHADYSSRRSLFWCIANVQDMCFSVLADTVSCQKLMSEIFYKSLSLEVPLTPPGATFVVAGNGKALHLC